MRLTKNQSFTSPWHFETDKLFAEDVTDVKMEKVTVSGEDASGGRLVVYTKKEQSGKTCTYCFM